MTFPDIEENVPSAPYAGSVPIPRRFVVYDSRTPTRPIGLGVRYPNGYTSVQWRVVPERENADPTLTELDEYSQPYTFTSYDEFASKVQHNVNWVD